MVCSEFALCTRSTFGFQRYIGDATSPNLCFHGRGGQYRRMICQLLVGGSDVTLSALTSVKRQVPE